MEITFRVIYHHSVVKEDIPKLSRGWKKKVERASEEKLMTRSEVYGKPLRRSLRGYRKLRVGNYRVIYRIAGDAVKVFVIQHRSVVYKIAEKRS